MKIRIATWNIAAGRKIQSLDWMDYSEEDIDYFYAQFKDLNLDIICLQESQFNNEVSFANQIARLLDYHTVLETTGCPSHIDSSFSMTPAIITRLEVASSEYFVLPHPTFPLIRNGKVFPAFDRNVIVASFGRFNVITTHPEPLGVFDLKYESGLGRELSKTIDDVFLGMFEKPIILAADMNFDNLSAVLPKTVEALDIMDLFRGEDTKPHGGHPDHIAFSNGLTVVDSGIIKTETDHYLCWAELELN
jgi:endonuclease/exonuclease/phosphatase family metal-dependent hydrolase